jgi:hypothetical protein
VEPLERKMPSRWGLGRNKNRVISPWQMMISPTNMVISPLLNPKKCDLTIN